MIEISPTARRLGAIEAIVDRFAPIVDTLPQAPELRAELISAVTALRPMGRSARWTAAVDRWIEALDQSIDSAPAWALHQPAVWAYNAT